MPRPRDILQRFRPAGTPGAATPTGVPADRVAEVAAELEPVLALLADAVQEADRVRAEGRAEAERRRQRSAEQAGALVASAHRQAQAARSDAALQAARDVEAEAATTLAEAERAAAAVRQRAAERLPRYVDRAVAMAREEMSP